MDNINELPEEKRPPELMLWDGTPEEINSWIKRAFEGKEKKEASFYIPDSELEG